MLIEQVRDRMADKVSDGKLRLEAEALRVARVIADATPPEGAGTGVHAAPARGAARVFREVQVVMTANGPRRRSTRPAEGDAIRCASALDLIEVRRRSRDADGPIFSPAEHMAAAEYEALFHRVMSGRVKCSSLDGGTGGGDAAGVMDAMIDSIRRLERMDARIASQFFDQRTGHLHVLRAEGPAAQAGRRSIFIQDLVHWALIRREPLTALLERRGWPKQTRYLQRLQKALAQALTAIYGL